ncbi:MAG TPA: hypothetical protein PKC43_04295 [Phycisphaerales bacterium]|nr:hypothetical protein [Phycisphaerales bacterium]HMP36648.1 hypothetical protein [Phycisphaerales bacterium]
MAEPRPTSATAIGRLLRGIGAAAAVALGACSAPAGKGSVALTGQGRDPAVLKGSFQLAAYAVGPIQTSVYMTDLPIDTLVGDEPITGQIVHVELLWKPIAGRTPVESTATNASIRHVVFAAGEVGVYGGAGFVSVRGTPGTSQLSLRIYDASMALLESTPGFVDVLTPAMLDGRVVAIASEERTLRVRRVVSQLVTNAFGETRIVRGSADDLADPDLQIGLAMALLHP